jgi:hypothetical protein
LFPNRLLDTPPGKPVPKSSSRKIVQGFDGMLLVTPDADWRKKWETKDRVPHFNQASEVHAGGKLFILTFFSNPRLNADGNTDVMCDVAVIRPDGSYSANQTDIPCLQVQLKENPRHIFLAPTVIEYVEEASDLRGEWKVEVTLKDKVRGVELPLKTSFFVR